MGALATNLRSRAAGIKLWAYSISISIAVVVVLEFIWSRVVQDMHLNPQDSTLLLDGGSALLALTGLVTALAVCTSVLLRRAIGQQEQLLDAQREKMQLKTAHQQVIENLPVGLFTYSEGRFEYTNWAWDELVLRKPGEAPVDAFLRAVHPEDQKEILHELDRCSRNEEPFNLNARIVDAFLEERNISIRGVPVYESDGRFRHLLGFNIDISEATRATTELHKTNIEIAEKNRLLTGALSELEANFSAMVESLVKAVEAKDPYTAGHSQRVMQYSVKMGEHFRLSPHELKILRMGTLIHDIGKIGIPDEILVKPSGLTKDEYEVIKKHPEVGFDMIQGIPLLKECAPIVRFHHERLDGSGYPQGLKEDEISFLVRISAVADVFDAMTSNRAYRRGLPSRVAIDELRREVALHRLDKDIVEGLAHVMSRESPSWVSDRAA